MRLSHILFPPRCPGCDAVMTFEERTEGFCKICRQQLHFAAEPVCKVCGKPVSGDTTELCADCAHRRHSFRQDRAVYVYEGVMREAMYRFKYSNRRAYAESFAADAVRLHGKWVRSLGIDLIVPIPMYAGKEKQRGYNQAAVLARALGRAFGIPADAAVLCRVEDTVPQKELDQNERRQNLKNAFNIEKDVVKSKRVLLADDIYTTGATMDAASGTLLASGAEAVYGLCACIGRDS